MMSKYIFLVNSSKYLVLLSSLCLRFVIMYNNYIANTIEIMLVSIIYDSGHPPSSPNGKMVTLALFSYLKTSTYGFATTGTIAFCVKSGKAFSIAALIVVASVIALIAVLMSPLILIANNGF
jgi:hypothetical protein